MSISGTRCPLLIVYLWQLIHLHSKQKSECFNKMLHNAYNYTDLTPVNYAADVKLMMSRNTISSWTLYYICKQSMDGNASWCACYWIWAPLIQLSVFGIVMFCCLSKYLIWNASIQVPTTCAWLTHWGRDRMEAISQTTFSSAFSWMKMFELESKFHWSSFLRVQLTIFHHWFR